MKLLIISLILAFSCITHADQLQKYEVYAQEGRFVRYTGVKPIILSANLKEQNPTTYSEAISAFGPAFVSIFSSSCFWEWHFDDGTILSAPPAFGKDSLAQQITLKSRKSDATKTRPNQQVDPIVTTPVDEVEAQSTQGHP